MIRLQNVYKYYPTKRGLHYVLHDASLEIPTGVNVAVVGRNGAGKSTLMRLLAGVDLPNSGHISTTYRMSWPLGLAGGISKTMTGRESTLFVCRIMGTPPAEIPEKLRFVEEFTELGKYFEMPVHTYSSGMRSRLKFATSMIFDFDCYIIDELTAVGDESFKEKARSLFREKRDSANFIKVTHNTQEVREECDAVIMLERGKLYYFDDVDEGLDTYRAVIRGERQRQDRKRQRRAAGESLPVRSRGGGRQSAGMR